MKVMNKVIKLSWVFLALVVVGCSSSSGTGSLPNPSFNTSDGGQVVFGQIDDQGRSLVLVDPKVFDNEYQSINDVNQYASLAVYSNDTQIIRMRTPVDYYSSNTTFIQFYLTNVSDQQEVNLVITRNDETRVTYQATLSTGSHSTGVTEYFTYNPVEEFPDTDPCENNPSEECADRNAWLCSIGYTYLCVDEQPYESY